MTEKKSLDKANGLELYLIKSKAEPLSINNLEHALSLFNSTGYAVAYLDYKVLIGKVNNNGFEFFNNEKIEEKYIQKLRLFNDDKELLIWRDNNGLKGRLRIDGEGEETFVVDACQVLWGTKKDELGNGWIKLFEDRGTELILPYDEGVIIDNKRNRLFIMTRNYISFHPETNQATYFDCRFIKFTNKQSE
jgi:CRISPR-associated protein (TIGR03984 family)